MDILKTLREKEGYSQEELAMRLGISRPTLIKYERKGVSIPTDTIKQLSEMFDLPSETFITGRIPEIPGYRIIPAKIVKKKENSLRIDIPQENIDKFREVLLYILGKIGALPNVGQAVIYKILYFIDFDYYELFEEQLIGAKYIKNKYGPTPVDFVKIVKKMEKAGELAEVKTRYFEFDQKKYIPVRAADISILSACEIKHIDNILDKYAHKSANEISAISHKDIPWIMTEEKQIIPYEAVFYRTHETSVREYAE